MAKFSRKSSGLPCDIWIDSEGASRNNPHNSPRVKVEVSSGQRVPVSISEDPQILIKNLSNKYRREISQVIPFIKKSHDILIKHWNKELDDVEALIALKDLANQ